MQKLPPQVSYHRREDTQQETRINSTRGPTWVNKYVTKVNKYVNTIYNSILVSPVNSLAVPLSQEKLRGKVVRSAKQSTLILPTLTSFYRRWSPERNYVIDLKNRIHNQPEGSCKARNSRTRGALLMRRRGCHLSRLCIQLSKSETRLASLDWSENPCRRLELHSFALCSSLHTTRHC